MMDSDDESIESMKRCLFPEEDWESELLSNEMEPYGDLDGDNIWSDQRLSPTSVSSHPGMSLNKQSTITMSEDGAEVTLDLSSMSLETPEKEIESLRRTALGAGRSNSLLDMEATPTPPNPKKRNTRNLSCCWPSDSAQHEDEYKVGSNLQLEKTISLFLEQSEDSQGTSGCSGWQAWSFFMTTGSKDQDPSQENIRSNLRNRACRGARKSRVRQIRRDLSPFAGSPRRSPHNLYRSRSFSIMEHAPGIVRVSKDRNPRGNSFTNVLQLCTMPENATIESPVAYRRDPTAKNVCYDSDPEDFTRRGHPPKTSLAVDKENMMNYQRYSYPRSVSTSPTGKMDDVHNEDAHYAVVQEFLNQTSTLVHHPTTTSSSGVTQPSSPVAVNGWLERGQRLRTIIQPKWMWKPKPRDRVAGQNFQISVKGIELLEITRIFKVERIDRNRYPLAKPRNCFIIKNLDNDEFCFEAKSFTERNRLVYSLKMVIARFGAQLIMADDRVYDEFFATTGSIPGEAPRFVRIKSIEDIDVDPSRGGCDSEEESA
jgi:hypothetical protein